jgi:succinate dehydrogenase/fumarate reductase cytochrome b subunit
VAGETQQTARAKTLGRLHAAGGFVLGGYVVFHLWQQWPALLGRDAWLERASHDALPQALKLVVFAVIVGHALLGALRLKLGPHPADDSATAGMRRLQLFFGALTLVFLAVHVPFVQWTPSPASTITDVYARLTDQLGRPSQLAIYLLGITAVCAHLGLGLSRALVTFGLAKDARTNVYLAGLLVAAVLYGWLQVLAWYAIGEPLLPFFLPTPAP